MIRDLTMKLRLVDNGYDDVVVKIEDDIPATWCNGIFLGLQEVMGRASSQLYLATGSRAFFRNVVVVVPSSWSSSRCPGTLNFTAAPPIAPAFVVAQPHPVYAHAPWTLQVGGCGQPGRNIYFTPRYLAETNYTEALGDPGRVVVHEWAKYRWGVYEEFGHPGDPLYPAFHRTPTNPHTPTGCSNIPVQGSMSSCDNPRDPSCRFSPSYNNNDGVTSSLMYMHHLPHVTHFCSNASHDTTAPNRQNALCQHRSVWDVILDHEDFANGNNPPGDNTRDVTPKFTFIQPVPTRYVIVVEDTAIMNIQKRWEFLRKAVRKLLVYDVPAGSKVGVVLFDQTARTKLPLTPTPETLDERQRLATSSLPRNPSRIAQSQKCIICGLQEAVRMLEGDIDQRSASGGVILLISSGSPIPLVPFDVEQLGTVVTQKGARVVPIIYPVTDRNPQPSPGVEVLAHLSGTQSFAVLDEGIGSDSKVSMMVALMDALYAAIRLFIPDSDSLPLVVHKKEFPGGIGSISHGSFTVDKSLGGEVKFTLIYYDLGHVGNMINLIDPHGLVQDTLNLQEEDGDVNMIFVTITNAMAGEWRYRVENRADSHQSLFTRVLATPRAPNSTSSMGQSERNNHAITLTAWTSSTASVVNISEVSKPVIVYAKVWCGSAPVVGARVEASLQRLGVNGTGNRYGPITFRLLDNGNGDADLTRGDGIYSRYLPAITAESGRYTLSVTATDNSGTAQVITSSRPPPAPRPRVYSRNHVPYSGQITAVGTQYTRARTYNPDWQRCCGSVVPYTTARETGHLSRTVTVGLVDIVGGGRNLSHIPPSRVSDFRAEINPASQQITFTWTSPGEWRDYGTVLQYEVVFSRNAAATGQGIGEFAREWPAPERAGEVSRHIARWGRHDGVYYAAIRGENRRGVKGAWSNTAEFFMPHPPTTTEINTRGSTQGGPMGGSVSELGVTTPQPGTLSTRDILAIVGAGCGLLVVVLILAVYYLLVATRRRRHHQEKKAVEVLEPVTTTPGGCDSDSETDSISKPPPPPEAQAVGEPEAKGKRPLSPIQSWPASTLLAEHERRHPSDPGEGGEAADLALHRPDLGVPYMPTMQPAHPHPFYYHTPNGHYIEDSLAMDGGSVASSQPSDSLLVYKVDPAAADALRPPSSSATPTPASWDGARRQAPMKVPPPTPPKPTLAAHLTLGGVAATPLGTERKRRNVTQV